MLPQKKWSRPTQNYISSEWITVKISVDGVIKEDGGEGGGILDIFELSRIRMNQLYSYPEVPSNMTYSVFYTRQSCFIGFNTDGLDSKEMHHVINYQDLSTDKWFQKPHLSS